MSNSSKKTILYIFLAYIFSIVTRLIWVYFFNDMQEFKFNNQFMINTNDGYLWAEEAKNILSGNTLVQDRIFAISILTVFIIKVTSFPIESVIFYMPIVLSSLIVIPLVLLGKSLNKLEVGFIAAILASVAWSYYNRTMIGYYDTDMLNIVFPMFLVWSLILALKTKEDKYILFSGYEIITYRLWYPQSYSLEFAFALLIILYIVYLFYKRKEYIYELKLLSIMILAMVYLPLLHKFIIVTLLYVSYKKIDTLKFVYFLLSSVVLIFLITGGFDPVIQQIKGYVIRDAIVSNEAGLNLHFYSVMQSIIDFMM